MAYVALYRSWRPQSFDDLVGQEPIKKALTNALETGRISHAYLFAGPRGTGKTSTARILAKALNCDKGPTAHPCNACSHCKEITEGTSADVIEIDAASNRGIEEMKKIREQVYFAPVSSRYKVYIIDEVHMVTADAFNALLKTLEEPPEHVVFILATTEPQKILNTILSRCQRFDFRRVTVDEIAAHLEKVCKGSGIQADKEALRLIAIQADGGMRDALSLLDQCSVMESPVTARTVRQVLGLVGRETLRLLVQNIGEKNLSAALDTLNDLLEQGREVEQILVELLEYFRALLLYSADRAYQEIYLTDTAEHLETLSKLFTRAQIVNNVERIHQAVQESKYSLRKKIVGELCLFDLCENRGDTEAALRVQVAELSQKVESLTRGGISFAPAAPAAPAAPVIPKPAPPAEKAAASVPLGAPVPNPPPAASFAAAKPVDDAQLFQAILGTAPEETESPAPAPVKKTAPRKKAAAPAVPSSGVPVLTGAGQAEGSQLWELVKKELEREGQRTFVVFAKMAHVVEYAGGLLVLATKSKTSKHKFEETKFRQLLLQILQRLTGQHTGLEVLQDKEVKLAAGAAPAQAAAPVPAKDAAADVQPAPAQPEKAAVPAEKTAESASEEKVSPVQVPESVKKALQVFGGEIYKE